MTSSSHHALPKHRAACGVGVPIWIGIVLFFSVSALLSYRLHAHEVESRRGLHNSLLTSFANFSRLNDTFSPPGSVYMWRVYGKYRVSVTGEPSPTSREVGVLLPGEVFLSPSSASPSYIVYPYEGYIHAPSTMTLRIQTSPSHAAVRCSEEVAVGVDLKGYDLTNVPTRADTPSACCTVCARSAGCGAWTWTPSKDCWLKTPEALTEVQTPDFQQKLRVLTHNENPVITSGIMKLPETPPEPSPRQSCPPSPDTSVHHFPPSSVLRTWRRGIDWTEQWPIGNGVMGALVGGTVYAQVIPISVPGMFVGGTKRRPDKNAFQHFSSAREHLLNNRFIEATKEMSKLERSRTLGMFQYLSDIAVVFSPSPLSLKESSTDRPVKVIPINRNRKSIIAHFIKALNLPQTFLSEDASTSGFGTPVYSHSALDVVSGVTKEVFITSSEKDTYGPQIHSREWFASVVDDVIVSEFRCAQVFNTTTSFEVKDGCLNAALQFSRDVSDHKQASYVRVSASQWNEHSYNPRRHLYNNDVQTYAVSVVYSPSASSPDSTSPAAVACSLVLCPGTNTSILLQSDSARVICNNADSMHTVTATVLRPYDGDETRNIEKECFSKLSTIPDIDSMRRHHIRKFESDMLGSVVSFDSIDDENDSDGICELVLPDLFEMIAAKSANDHKYTHLVALFVWFSKYLLLTSSTQHVANLQGLWADGPTSAWNGDYHLNINMQMIYWPMNALGMKSSSKYLDEFIVALSRGGGETARDYYNAKGWVAHGFTDHSMNGDLLADCQWSLCISCGAWIALHMWNKHTYFSDNDYQALLNTYRGIAEFLLDYAVQDCDGTVLLGPTTSPENSYAAVTHNISMQSQTFRSIQQLTMTTAIDATVFTEVAEAYYQSIVLSEYSGVTSSGLLEHRNISRALSELLLKLQNLGYPIVDVKNGRIREYGRGDVPSCRNVAPAMIDEDIDVGHRHFSSLLWLFPGVLQWSHGHAQNILNAAKILLRAKERDGGAHTGWSAAWAAALWARLGSPDDVWRHTKQIMHKYVSSNLMGLHPPLEAHGKFKCPTCFREQSIDSGTVRGRMASAPGGRGLGLIDNSKFQIDTNAGLLAALMEGIVHSHERNIVELLPAIPDALGSGYVRNLYLRGDMSLNMMWRRGCVAAAVITAYSPHHWLRPNRNGAKVTLRSQSKMRVAGQWTPHKREIKSETSCMKFVENNNDGAIEILFQAFPCSVLICHSDRYSDECVSDIRAISLPR